MKCVKCDYIDLVWDDEKCQWVPKKMTFGEKVKYYGTKALNFVGENAVPIIETSMVGFVVWYYIDVIVQGRKTARLRQELYKAEVESKRAYARKMNGSD